MEYCKNCGAAINKNTGYCTNCGLHVESASKKKGNLILRIVIVVIVVIALILGGKAVLNGIASITDVAPNDGYMEVVDGVVDAVYVDLNPEKFASLMPEIMIQKLIDESYNGDEQAFYAALKEVYAEMEGMQADPDSVTWEINEEMDMVAAMLDHYEAGFQAENGTSVKIRSAKGLDITISYTSSGEAHEERIYVLVGMIEDEWYLIDFTQDTVN